MIQMDNKSFIIKNPIKKNIAWSVFLILITSVISNTQSANAATPVITSSATISNGASSPQVLVNGNNFASNLDKFGFTVDVGTTGLTFDSVAFVNSSRVRVNLRGTAQAGSISIQANSSVFLPVADSASNTLTITVPDTLIAQTITFNALTPMILNGSDQLLTASSTSGLNVSFTSLTINTCRIISQKIHALAARNCSIMVSQTGNSTYQSATDVVNSVIISAPAPAVIQPTVTKPTAVTTFATLEYSPSAVNNTFSDVVISSSGNGQLGAVKLKLLIPSRATQGQAVFLVSSYSSDSENDQGFFVARVQLVDKSGQAINRVDKAFEINIPKGYFYSEVFWSSDGLTWQRILETSKETLPSDSHAAFFREVDGSVSILTDQLGLFGYRFPQEELKVLSPVQSFALNSQIQLSNSGGSGSGALTFGTSTASVCSVTADGVVSAKQAGKCFVFVRKFAAEQYIDALSTKIIVNVQAAGVSATSSNPKTVPATSTVIATSQSGCNSLSYSLSISPTQVQANFCPEDAGKVAILYVRVNSSTRKWVDKKVVSVVIDSNGAALFQVDKKIGNSHFLHVFVNREHRL